jgi:UPF0716 protein FxsA
MRLLFLFFIVMPIVELMLLFEVGQRIGALPTIALVLLTASLGVGILRHQSSSTLRRAQDRLQSGELPGQEIIEGFLISIGGALLLTPGFITDLFAIFLLLPFTRRALVRQLLKNGRWQTWGGSATGFTFTRFGRGFPPTNGAGRGGIYEGEFTRDGRSDKTLGGPDGD